MGFGKHQLRLLRFACDYPGWHTYGKDRSTRDALKALAATGLIEVNQFRQFRIRPAKSASALESAAVRMMVGITKKSTPTCQWYEGIEQDGAEEARKILEDTEDGTAVIHNLKEFMWLVHDYEVGDRDPDVVQAAANKYTEKETDCGAWCKILEDGIRLGCIIEGMDGDGVTTDPLKYPFTLADYRETIEYIEGEASRLWQEINEDDGDEIEGQDPDHVPFDDLPIEGTFRFVPGGLLYTKWGDGEYADENGRKYVGRPTEDIIVVSRLPNPEAS